MGREADIGWRGNWVESGHRHQYARGMRNAAIVRPMIGLVLALATSACENSSTRTPITVDEFIAQIDQLDGQTVSVEGFLGECVGYSCMLYRNKAESADVDRAMSEMRAALDEGVTDVSGFQFPDHPAVSIGNESQFFDLLAAFFYQDSYVVITGKATNQCRSGMYACFDRAGDLEPTSIQSAPARSL